MLTNPDTIAPGEVFPPRSERGRFDGYDRNKNLWAGNHLDEFLGWDRLLSEDNHFHDNDVQLILNWHRRVSLLWADLLIGEEPRIAVEGAKSVVDQVDKMLQRNRMSTVGYEVAIDVSRFGTGVFKIRTDEAGLAVVEAQPTSGWLPVFDKNNIRRVQAHVLFWEHDADLPVRTGRGDFKIIRFEMHGRGGIVNRAFEKRGNKLGAELDIGEVSEGQVLMDQPSGVDDFLVFPVHNVLASDEGFGTDDYKDVDSIVHEIEIRMSQNSRILDRHADPGMAGPESALDTDPLTGQERYRGGQYLPLLEGESPPQYVTWNGNLEASNVQVEKLTELLYLISETSPAAFGQLKSGLAESGTALRRLLLATILKTRRLRSQFDPVFKDVIRVATQIETGTKDAVVNVEWFDGLPEDVSEKVENEVQRQGAGLSSKRSSIARIDNLTDAQVDAEFERMDKENKKDAPAEKPGEGGNNDDV